MLKIRLFGTLMIEKDGGSLPLPPSTQARDLLAYLALFHERKHTRNLLVGVFWPDHPEERARRALSQALWQIRRSFSDLVAAEAETISFSPQAPFWVDAQEFEKLAKPALNITSQETICQELEQAISLYHADFLEGNYHDWALLERERLRGLFLQVLERLGQLEKSSGHYAKALNLALRLSTAEPLNEAAHREIMRLHHLLGQPERAARQFELCRDILRRELDVDPSPQTLAVVEEIKHLTERAHPLKKTDREGMIPAPLVGRETDRAVFLHFIEGIFKKLGGLVLLEGEAGVGKTRLLQDVARDAEWRGAQVLWGYARETQELKPYAALVEALQSGLSPLRVTQVQQVVEPVWLQTVFPLLSPHTDLPDIQPAPPLPPVQEQARLVEAIVRLVQGWANIIPLVLILEDLHWADQDTFDLLPALTRRLSSCSLLIICSYRGEDARSDPQVWEALQAVNRSNLLAQHTLSRLDEQATGEFIRRSLGLASPAPLFEERLFHETDGNPLFVLETLRVLQDEGFLTREESGIWSTPWDESTADYTELPLPPEVEKVITHRLKLLPVNSRRILDMMAVLGSRFDFELLNAVSDLETPALLDQTRELIRRSFIEETNDGYRFSHDKIHQTVYEGIETGDRIRFHHRVAVSLQETRPAETGALAYHSWQAQDWEKAAYYHQRAGEQAGKVYANAEAINHFSRALEAIHRQQDLPDLRQMYSIRLARERIFDLQGEREPQTLELDALEDLADSLDDHTYRAEVALRRARQADLTCDFPNSITAASQAASQARAAKDPTTETESYMEWGWCLLMQGEHNAARAQFKQALVLARSNALKRLEADALHGVGTVGLVTGDYSEAKNYFHQVLDICRHVDIRPREGSTFANLGYIAAAQGDHTASQFYNEQALRLHRETGDQRGAALVMQASSEHFLAEGKFSIAQEYMEQALTIQESIQARDNMGVTLNSLGVLYHRLGDYEQARDYYKRAQAIFVEIGIPFYQGKTLAYLSLLSHHLDEHQTAWEQSREGLEIARKINDRLGEGLLLDTLGHALTGLGQLEQATEAYQMALNLHQELNDLNMAAESRAGLARLALFQGDLPAAIKQVEEILHIQKGGDISGVNEPFRVYLTCYQVLNATRDSRAAGILRKTHELLMTHKVNIQDARLEDLFLENIAAHREIIAAYTQYQGNKVHIRLPPKDSPAGRPLHASEYVDALWTPFAPEDEAIPGKVARRRHRMARLLEEARQQGAAPTNQHLAEALGAGLRTIERDIANMKK